MPSILFKTQKDSVPLQPPRCTSLTPPQTFLHVKVTNGTFCLSWSDECTLCIDRSLYNKCLWWKLLRPLLLDPLNVKVFCYLWTSTPHAFLLINLKVICGTRFRRYSVSNDITHIWRWVTRVDSAFISQLPATHFQRWRRDSFVPSWFVLVAAWILGNGGVQPPAKETCFITDIDPSTSPSSPLPPVPAAAVRYQTPLIEELSVSLCGSCDSPAPGPPAPISPSPFHQGSVPV